MIHEYIMVPQLKLYESGESRLELHFNAPRSILPSQNDGVEVEGEMTTFAQASAVELYEVARTSLQHRSRLLSMLFAN